MARITLNWIAIANNVKSIQPILRATVVLDHHTTDSQTSRASKGMRQNSEATTASGKLLGTLNLSASINNRK
ncbi:MAG: hypothetical protein ABSG97_04120 [Sedimentisphaerales bacterium]